MYYFLKGRKYFLSVREVRQVSKHDKDKKRDEVTGNG